MNGEYVYTKDGTWLGTARADLVSAANYEVGVLALDVLQLVKRSNPSRKKISPLLIQAIALRLEKLSSIIERAITDDQDETADLHEELFGERPKVKNVGSTAVAAAAPDTAKKTTAPDNDPAYI